MYITECQFYNVNIYISKLHIISYEHFSTLKYMNKLASIKCVTFPRVNVTLLNITLGLILQLTYPSISVWISRIYILICSHSPYMYSHIQICTHLLHAVP